MGRIFGALGHIWGACRIILPHLGRKTASLRHVEAISEDRGRILAPTWAILEHLGAILEHLGANWEQLGANMAKNLTVFLILFVLYTILGNSFEASPP